MKPEEALLTAWQKRLMMEDWTIKLETDCAPEDFRLDDVCGECEWQEVNKSAVIRILDPKFYGDRLIPFDYERTLVHELLHAKFALLENSENELQNRLVHQLIEELARAFTEREGASENSKEEEKPEIKRVNLIPWVCQKCGYIEHYPETEEKRECPYCHIELVKGKRIKEEDEK